MRQTSPRSKKSRSGAYAVWSTWAKPEVLDNLKNSKWQDVVQGINDLRELYDNGAKHGNAAAYGLMSIFIGRTFTPKVMNQLLQNILFYLMEDSDSITDDTLQVGIKFFIDKVPDRKLEKDLFDIGDIFCCQMGADTMFNQLYPSLSAKNPALLSRILVFFSYILRSHGAEARINSKELINNIRPLCSHQDPTVRHAATECVTALSFVYGEEILNQFQTLHKAQLDEVRKQIDNNSMANGTYITNSRPSSMSVRNPSPKSAISSPRKNTPASMSVRNASPSNIGVASRGGSPSVSSKKSRLAMSSRVFRTANTPSQAGSSVMAPSVVASSANPSIAGYSMGASAASRKSISKDNASVYSRKSFYDSPRSPRGSINFDNQSIRSKLSSPSERGYNSPGRNLRISDSPPDNYQPSRFYLASDRESNIPKPSVSRLPQKNKDDKKKRSRSTTLLENNKVNISYSINSDDSYDELFDVDLLDGISKNNPVLNVKKSLEAIGRRLDSKYKDDGDNCIEAHIFKPLYNELAQWLTEENVHILLIVANIVLTSFRLVRNFTKIEPLFLQLTLNLLSFNSSQLKYTMSEVLRVMHKKHPYFIKDIVSPAFDDLTDETRDSLIRFLKTVKLQDEDEFIIKLFIGYPQIGKDVINEYIKNPRNEQRIRDKLPPEYTGILSSIYMTKPDQLAQEKRHSAIDKLYCMNHIRSKSRLRTKIESFWLTTFKINMNPSRDELNFVLDTLANEVKNNFFAFALVSDMVFIWIAIVLNTLDRIEGDLMDFIQLILHQYRLNKRLLNDLDVYVVVPIICEFYQNANAMSFVEEVSHPMLIISSLIDCVSYLKNSDAIVFALEMLETKRLSDDQAAFLAESISRIKDSDNSLLLQKINVLRNRLPLSGMVNHNTSSATMISNCEMHPDLAVKMRSKSFQVYQWIVLLTSQDMPVSIEALKNITKQVDADPSVFTPHLEVLILSIISKIHEFFAVEPPPSRLYKYISYCIFELLDKTSLSRQISQACVQQLVYEIITRLSNGLTDTVTTQSLNFLMVKLMELCPQATFKALLTALGEFDNPDQFNENWVRLALKCFEPCRDAVYGLNPSSLVDCLCAVEHFLRYHNYNEIRKCSFGTKMVNSIKSFVEQSFEANPGIRDSSEFRQKVGNNAHLFNL